ncbi:MAG: ThuA domain-containing protein [Oscillospiraceae bacterium]|jgi:trehalose utilization protein|nr:ThuA domain-containing protein [Oscillospiraceae bacterium]
MPELKTIRVLVWNENRGEQTSDLIRSVYPKGIHGQVAAALSAAPDIQTRTATLDDPEHGLTEDALSQTDVLFWWGHMWHHLVSDEAVNRVIKHVHNGMGFVALHSAHASKPFAKLMGTNTGRLRWHEEGLKTRLWKLDYSHPIAEGIGDYFELPQEETYGEHFDIPTPESLVFVSWFPSGEVFRSGCCWTRSGGRIFFFQPGHETFPIYYDENVKKVLVNAARWAARPSRISYVFDETKSLEKLD